jgi:hypothetical protein
MKKTVEQPTTAFEQECERLGLTTRDEIAQSRKLRAWVIGNFNTRYVPEHLLATYGLPTPEQFV